MYRSNMWRTIGTAALFYSAGAILSGGCGVGNLVGYGDANIGVACIAASIAAGVASPMLLRHFAHRKIAVGSFVFGICSALLGLFFFWRSFADWYFMSRCKQGLVKACVESFTQGSQRFDTDDFYAPRRACDFGRLEGCEVELLHDSKRNTETCTRVGALCRGDAAIAPIVREQACTLGARHCSRSPLPAP